MLRHSKQRLRPLTRQLNVEGIMGSNPLTHVSVLQSVFISLQIIVCSNIHRDYMAPVLIDSYSFP